jgi:hypothetical protein
MHIKYIYVYTHIHIHTYTRPLVSSGVYDPKETMAEEKLNAWDA